MCDRQTTGSARLGSARLGSARLGSARLGSARLGSARLGSARLGSARLQCGLYHNLAPNARIIALGALLVLLQACGGGGGGGGGSSMMMCLAGQVRDSGDDECRAPENDDECMRLEAMTPVFVGDACRAECGEGQTRNMTTHECETSMPMPMPVTCTAPTPFSHGDDCFAECPPAAPVSNNNVCEAADVASECHATLPVFDRNGSGICEAAQNMSECHATLPVFNADDECVAASEMSQCHPTLPVFNADDECVAATEMSQCHPTLPVFNADDECEAADVESECHATLPFFDPVDSTCKVATIESQCPDDEPEFDTGSSGNCRPREARDCTGTTPIFVSADRTCRIAMSDTECSNLSSATPVADIDGSCRETRQADCTGETPVLDNNACRARDGTGGGTVALSIAGTNVVFEETIEDGHTDAYNEISAAAANEPESLARTQSGNCGEPCDNTTPRTIDTTGIIASGLAGGNATLNSFTIEEDGDGSSTFILNPVMLITAPDRRFRPSADGGLDGWDYRRYVLRSSARTAEADIIVWADPSDDYYLAGGVFAYNPDQSPTRGASTIFDNRRGILRGTTLPVLIFEVNIGGSTVRPTVGEATYTGHSFGHYTTLPAPGGLGTNLGFFAARASLTANFTNSGGSISGTIDNFLLSEDREFSVERKSPLEDALSGLVVMLSTPENPGSISSTPGPSATNLLTFRGDTSATGVMVGNTPLTLTGKYGGLFYKAQGTGGIAQAPSAVGGTWGAAGITNPAPTAMTEGFGISFIGAFGAKRCRDATPIFDRTTNACRAPENNAECASLGAALPIEDGGACIAARNERECHATLPVFDETGETGVCREIQTSADCAGLDATMPVLGIDGACRAAVQSECDHTATPILDNGACRMVTVANGAAECAAANPALPFFVSADNTCRGPVDHDECAMVDATVPIYVGSTGVCRPARDSDCSGTDVVENGACVAAACGTGQTRIGGADGTCTPPGLTRTVSGGIPDVDTFNYNTLADVGGDAVTLAGNSAYFGGSSTLRDTVTHGSNPRTNDSETTADEVQLTKGAIAGSGLAGLTIRRGRTGTGFTWEPLPHQRVAAPTIAATARDRRARPEKLGWSYPTIALDAADLLDDEADNDNDNDSESLRNVRAAVVEWNDGSYYMAGGVFGYDTAVGTRTNESEIVGVFADGDITNLASQTDVDGDSSLTLGNPLPTDNSAATYTGHSFGTYATRPAAEGEGNRGFFAADATFTANFTSPSASLIGTIDNFLFSSRGDPADKLGFTAAGQSLLENALTVTVNLATAASGNNSFEGTINPGTPITATATRRFPDPRDNVTVNLRGRWYGAFFGQGAVAGTAAQPPGFGGTWSVSGQTGNPNSTAGDPGTNGFGISFIGTFGTRRVPAVPSSITFDSALPDPDNHARYEAVAAANNRPLFADGIVSGTASSLTLGSAIGNHDNDDGTTPVRTNDRVYLFTSNLGPSQNPTGKIASVIYIDVGNNKGGDDLFTTFNLPADADALATDRRRTELGTIETMVTTSGAMDPVWNYLTQTFAEGNPDTPSRAGELLAGAAFNAANEYRAFVVDWSSDFDNYLGGGVWVRTTGTGATDVEVGAFVDGENPTEIMEVTEATGIATYRGHAYGRYSLNMGIASEANPGFFAAKATLNADFGNATQDGTIAGSISNFLFSQDNSFVDSPASKSALEAAIGGPDGFRVNLQQAGIVNNRFNNDADSNTIQLPGDKLLEPEGRWAGRFYSPQTQTSGDAPPVVGGVFAVSDATTTGTNDVSFSIIGSFGAKLPPPSSPP